ncbi:MAG: aldo/keto reductase [Actinomycetaceae bacterium]|nr:aldo/keto reductase [Actinomycetaceae bacterium]
MTDFGVPTLKMYHGLEIPQLGLGTYKVPPAEAQRVVEEGAEVGYRHFDTAQMYGNELEVGRGIRAAALSRDEYFLTTKLDNSNHLPDDARRTFDKSLQDLQVDYVDLFLIHWPLPTLYGGDFIQTWEVLQEFYEDGRARAIGLSNFLEHHIQPILDQCDIKPMVNQVESHPYMQIAGLHAFHDEHQIVTEAWSPLARGAIVNEPLLQDIGEPYGKTASQVALRWALQRGDVVFPKSMHQERMRENFELFDFELTSSDMELITSLDKGEDGRCGSHPNTMDRL